MQLAFESSTNILPTDPTTWYLSDGSTLHSLRDALAGVGDVGGLGSGRVASCSLRRNAAPPPAAARRVIASVRRVVPLAAYGLYAIDTALHSPSLRRLSAAPRSRSVPPAQNIALSVTGPNCRSNERLPKFVKRTSLAKTSATNSATVATSAPLPTTGGMQRADGYTDSRVV